MWSPQIDNLKEFSTITYDLLGHGKTPLSKKNISFEEFSNQLTNLNEELNMKKIHIVGFSIGSLIARNFATKYNSNEICHEFKKPLFIGSANGYGGGGYGAGVSLRNTNLTLNEIINVIKCGRPGTGMPYFLRKAYKEEKCYDTTFEDYDESYRPVSSKTF